MPDPVLISYIPQLCRMNKIDRRKFQAECFERGLSLDTAARLWRGETSFTTGTLAKVAPILGATSIGSLVDIKVNGR